MGLAILGKTTGKSIHWHYGTLHDIRGLVAIVKGEFESLAALYTSFRIDDNYKYRSWESNSPHPWEKYPEYYQLLHFSDCDGIFIPSCYLMDVDIYDSFVLGDLDALVNELNLLFNSLNADIITKYPEVVNNLREFKTLAEAELENDGVVKFS